MVDDVDTLRDFEKAYVSTILQFPFTGISISKVQADNVDDVLVCQVQNVNLVSKSATPVKNVKEGIDVGIIMGVTRGMMLFTRSGIGIALGNIDNDGKVPVLVEGDDKPTHLSAQELSFFFNPIGADCIYMDDKGVRATGSPNTPDDAINIIKGSFNKAKRTIRPYWKVQVGDDVKFVGDEINDMKLFRAKHHEWKVKRIKSKGIIDISNKKGRVEEVHIGDISPEKFAYRFSNITIATGGAYALLPTPLNLMKQMPTAYIDVNKMSVVIMGLDEVEGNVRAWYTDGSIIDIPENISAEKLLEDYHPWLPLAVKIPDVNIDVDTGKIFKGDEEISIIDLVKLDMVAFGIANQMLTLEKAEKFKEQAEKEAAYKSWEIVAPGVLKLTEGTYAGTYARFSEGNWGKLKEGGMDIVEWEQLNNVLEFMLKVKQEGYKPTEDDDEIYAEFWGDNQ